MAETELKPYVERDAPGHMDSGGRVVVPFADDDEMLTILANLAPRAAPRLTGDQLVERLRAFASDPTPGGVILYEQDGTPVLAFSTREALCEAADRIESDAVLLSDYLERDTAWHRQTEGQAATIQGLVEALEPFVAYTGERWREYAEFVEHARQILAAAKQGEGRS